MSKKGKKKGAKSSDSDSSLILKNKKAFHEYEVLESLECGIALQGTEVKSLRERKVNFSQTFATVIKGELILIGLNISHYKMGNIMNHEPERKRKLLAHKREIVKLAAKIEQKGYTLVPLKLYWNHGKCKVEIGVVRGKQLHDKRDSSRDKDIKRNMEREVNRYR
ncbi:MAG: SsrA-binding protein SmpB [Planctomycetota bacterium]|jgi:SsrA-binding protein